MPSTNDAMIFVAHSSSSSRPTHWFEIAVTVISADDDSRGSRILGVMKSSPPTGATGAQDGDWILRLWQLRRRVACAKAVPWQRSQVRKLRTPGSVYQSRRMAGGKWGQPPSRGRQSIAPAEIVLCLRLPSGEASPSPR